MTKTQIPTEFAENAKPKCPDCQQALTYIRTKSQKKKWYCYTCEKYVDLNTQTPKEHLSNLSQGMVSGLQVVDPHGMIIGRVARVILNDTGEVGSLIVAVDKEPLKTSLRIRGIPEEVRVDHGKVAAIGDVVVLSEVFSFTFSSNTDDPQSSTDESQPKKKQCPGCTAVILLDAKFCINCGRRLEF